MDDYCEHSCIQHQVVASDVPIFFGTGKVPHCSKCMKCNCRITYGELNQHLRECHTNTRGKVLPFKRREVS